MYDTNPPKVYVLCQDSVILGVFDVEADALRELHALRLHYGGHWDEVAPRLFQQMQGPSERILYISTHERRR